ncbi:MAG: hypothetical protein KDA60_08365 [Planctomycetales bacterium]|nr:hypothetical protein [Planctomycetales bacterium]
MRTHTLTKLLLVALMASLVVAGPLPANSQESEQNDVVIELFTRRDSAQCDAASEYLRTLSTIRPGVVIQEHDVLQDRKALTKLWELSRRFQRDKAGVPTIYLTDQLVVGFQDSETTGSRIESLLTIQAYVRSGCRHCQEAKSFLDGMVARWPAVRVVYHDVLVDPQARTEVNQVAQRYNVRVASFPCLEVAGRLIVGFRGEQITGQQIESYFRMRSGLTSREEAEQRVSQLGWRFDAGAYRAVGRLVPWTARAVLRTTASTQLSLVATHELPQDNSAAPDDVPTSDKWSAEHTRVPGAVPEPDRVPQPEDVPLPDDVPMPDDVPAPETDPSGLSSATPQVESPEVVEVPVFGSLHVQKLGMPAFTFLIGLVDGFNPCAMWVLVFLLSVLVNIKERKKILVIAGTFVVVSGLAYFAFMAAWFNVFQLIGLLRPVQIGLGTLALVVGIVNVKDFFAFHQGVTFSIPDSAKPGIYRRVREIVTAKHLFAALAGAVVLAVVVNVVELLCTAGLPALYTQILAMQQLPLWAEYAYLALYIVAYMLDDSLLVGAVVLTLSHRKLQETEGRWLKLLSGSVILLLGSVMILRPEWLA